jgi:hypothetical protein
MVTPSFPLLFMAIPVFGFETIESEVSREGGVGKFFLPFLSGEYLLLPG